MLLNPYTVQAQLVEAIVQDCLTSYVTKFDCYSTKWCDNNK